MALIINIKYLHMILLTVRILENIVIKWVRYYDKYIRK